MTKDVLDEAGELLRAPDAVVGPSVPAAGIGVDVGRAGDRVGQLHARAPALHHRRVGGRFLEHADSEVALGDVDVPVLQLIAVSAADVGQADRGLGPQLALDREGQLVLVGRLEVVVDDDDVDRRRDAVDQAERPDEGASELELVVQRRFRRLEHLQRHDQRDVPVVTADGGLDRRLPVAEGIPGDGEIGRDVRVVDVEILLAPQVLELSLTRLVGEHVGTHVRDAAAEVGTRLAEQRDDLGLEAGVVLETGERRVRRLRDRRVVGLVQPVGVEEDVGLFEEAVELGGGVEELASLRVDLLAVDPHAGGDRQVLDRLDLILDVDAPVLPGGADVVGLGHGDVGGDEAQWPGTDPLLHLVDDVGTLAELAEVALALDLDTDLQPVGRAEHAAGVDGRRPLDGEPLPVVVLIHVVGARDQPGVGVEALRVGEQRGVGDAAVLDAGRRRVDLPRLSCQESVLSTSTRGEKGEVQVRVVVWLSRSKA